MIQFLSATGSASMTETLFTLLPMILIIVFMFILIYLPQKRQETGSDRTKIRFRRTAIASVEKLDMGGKDTTPAKK